MIESLIKNNFESVLEEDHETERRQVDGERLFMRLLACLGFNRLDYTVQYKLSNIPHYELDFAFPTIKVFVKLDGGRHGESRNKPHDLEKNSWLVKNGWKGLIVDERHLAYHFDDCAQQIFNWFEKLGVMSLANNPSENEHDVCPYKITMIG